MSKEPDKRGVSVLIDVLTNVSQHIICGRFAACRLLLQRYMCTAHNEHSNTIMNRKWKNPSDGLLLPRMLDFLVFITFVARIV